MQFERFCSLSDSVVGSFPQLHQISVKLPTAPDLCTLGTLFAIGEELEEKKLETVTEFKQEGREERDRRENEGLGDRWGEKQSVVIPEINTKFIG